MAKALLVDLDSCLVLWGTGQLQGRIIAVCLSLGFFGGMVLKVA